MKKRILIVDDSALMRKYLRQILEPEKDFEVHLARDGKHALEQIQEVDPHVVTLDINMPEMDGLTCLAHIMTEFPRPVVMISSLTEKGALATFEALEMGAVDYIGKPGGTVSHNIMLIEEEIVSKVRAAARSRPRRTRARAEEEPAPVKETPRPRPAPRKRAASRSSRGPRTEKLVLVGVSTGGPGTLETILPDLPGDLSCPILIAQHMPANFTKVFAKRLDRLCAVTVMEVSRPTPLEPGMVMIAQGGHDVELQERLGRIVATPVSEDPEMVWHPCVTRMVRSAMNYFEPRNLIAVQLTGMGNDGAEAMADLYRQGGRTIAESESSSVVFGMPRELIELGGAEQILSVDRIATQLVRWLKD